MSELFNNPMVNSALKSMSKEQLENYKKIGEQMYGNVNFEDSTIINSLNPPIAEAIAYIEEGIKSGLLPEDLEEDEVNLLTETYGDEWYLRYGFTRNQVPESGLSLKMKKDIEKAVESKLQDHKRKQDLKKKKKLRKLKKKENCIINNVK